MTARDLGRSLGLTCAAALLMAGCPHRDPWPLGGDGGGPTDAGGPGGIPDARPSDRVDARPGDRDAGVPTDCFIRMNLGDLLNLDGEAQASGGSPSDPDILYFMSQLDNDPKPDLLAVEMYKGFGAFTGGITTGDFEVAGAELNYATCGICVRIMANVDMATGDIGQQYLATGGKVTLTSITGDLTGALDGIRFEHVTIDPTTFESIPVNDGCFTRIDSASFDAPITFGP